MNLDGLSDESRYKLLRLLESDPNISQRELAKEMGVSVGKVNYCIKALVDVGYIKLQNFAKSKNKSGYMYVITPSGIKEKSHTTIRFLRAKQDQYEALKKEIAQLKQQVEPGLSGKNDSRP